MYIPMANEENRVPVMRELIVAHPLGIIHGADQLSPSLAPREQRMRTLTSSSCAPEYQQTSSAPDGSSAIAAPWFSPTAGAGSSARKIEGAASAAGGASQLSSSAKTQA